MKSLILALPLFALVAWTRPAAPVSEPSAPQEATDHSQVALAIGSAYLTGISGGDLDELDLLFVPDDSSVFENGSNEGTWEHYKEHHLAPEQEAVQNFVFTTQEEFVEPCGAGFLVRKLGGFSLDANGETRKYRAAVTFMVVEFEGDLRILHMHWSSRALR